MLELVANEELMLLRLFPGYLRDFPFRKHGLPSVPDTFKLRRTMVKIASLSACLRPTPSLLHKVTNRNTTRQNSVVQWLSHLDPSGWVQPLVRDRIRDNAERPETYSSLRLPEHRSPHDPSAVHERSDNVASWNQGGYPMEMTTLSRIWEPELEYSNGPPQSVADFNHTGPESCNIGTQILPGKTYERKPRRRTRKDRYDPKRTPRRQETAKSGAGERTMKPREAKLKKRRHGRKGLGDQFVAPNVSQNRLTLSSNFDVGLFARGRASSPVKRRELPDLSFSEMKFLSRPNKPSQSINATNGETSATSNKPQIKDISEYFSRKQPAERSRESSARAIEQSGSDPPRKDQPLSIRCVLTKDPPATPRVLQPRLDMIEPQYSKRTSRSTTKYTWSETTAEVAPRQERNVDIHRQVLIAGPQATAQYSPPQSTALKENKWERSSPLTSEFVYDPFIVSKTHDMMFRNAYIAEAQHDTAPATDQMCYTLRELQTLADRYLPVLTEPEDGLVYPSEAVEHTRNDENDCQLAQKNEFRPIQVANSRTSRSTSNLTQAAQALDQLEHVVGYEAANPLDSLSPRRAADSNRRSGTDAVNIGREGEFTSSYAMGRSPGHGRRNYSCNVFLLHTPARDEGSRNRSLAPTPQHFWGSRFQEYSDQNIVGDQKRANTAMLESGDENLIPTTPSIGNCSEIDFEPTLLSDPGSLHGYSLIDNRALETNNHSLGHSEWKRRPKPNPLGHQWHNAPVDLQGISGSPRNNNTSAAIPPYDSVRGISPHKQNFNSVSTPDLPLFWRPNKLY